MAERIRSSFDRRPGIDRRCFFSAAHVPERRSGTERRVSGERRKDWIRTSQWSSILRELNGADRRPYSIVKEHEGAARLRFFPIQVQFFAIT